jgi:hypothetical protein
MVQVPSAEGSGRTGTTAPHYRGATAAGMGAGNGRPRGAQASATDARGKGSGCGSSEGARRRRPFPCGGMLIMRQVLQQRHRIRRRPETRSGIRVPR